MPPRRFECFTHGGKKMPAVIITDRKTMPNHSPNTTALERLGRAELTKAIHDIQRALEDALESPAGPLSDINRAYERLAALKRGLAEEE